MMTAVMTAPTRTEEHGTTVVELPQSSRRREVRRTGRSYRRSDVLALVGAGAAGLSTSVLLFTTLAPFSGPVAFVIVTFLLFNGFYAALVSLDEDGPTVRDRVAMVVMHGLALILLCTLCLIVGYTAYRGWKALIHLNFFEHDLSRTGPQDPLTSGGIIHAVIGTLEQITIALILTVPLALACAVYLNEVPGRFARFVRTIVEAMTALPSIIAGLFIYATFILILGFPKSGLAASLAISVMMLPIIIRAADVVLRLVPGSLKEASYATGASQWRTVWHVTLPTARSGLATAVILGTARGIGETSPVLLTAGYTGSLALNPTHGPQVSLPLLTYTLSRFPEATMVQRALGAATVLLGLVFVLFIVARLIGGRGPDVLSKRQRKRRDRQSANDAQRFAARIPTPALVGAGAPVEIVTLPLVEQDPEWFTPVDVASPPAAPTPPAAPAAPATPPWFSPSSAPPPPPPSGMYPFGATEPFKKPRGAE
jgi:phosphate transport system permease protein